MLTEALKAQLTELVQSHPVVLFIKGTRAMPQCGFSATVVRILDELLSTYETVDVLADPALREGIKAFSDWPTIPQLYVNGKFVGGCDIVREMHASGELQALLATVPPPTPPKAPAIVVTDIAARAFQSAAEQDASEDVLRLEVSANGAYDLFFGPKRKDDVVVTTNGTTLHFDWASARRADGLTIDFVDGPQGGGFKITRAGEAAPGQVRSMSPTELKALLDRGEKVELFDVRPESERARAKIDAARPLDREAQDYIFDLPKDALIVFHCHHGIRSRSAAEHFAREGFVNVYNLEGGIDAWSRMVDPSVPRY